MKLATVCLWLLLIRTYSNVCELIINIQCIKVHSYILTYYRLIIH
jgi:hypothetical protein